jgi:hypothetical protein
MRHQVSKELYAYWSDLRGDRPAPDRSELDLLALRDVLADTFIVEEGVDGSFPLRVSGTRVEAIWGEDRKGACFSEVWRASDRLDVISVLAHVAQDSTPVVVSVRVQAPGDARLDLELLLLPLRHFGRSQTRILGALLPLHHADWLGLSTPGPLEMISMRRVEGAPSRSMRTPQKRPRLVVYNGGKD